MKKISLIIILGMLASIVCLVSPVMAVSPSDGNAVATTIDCSSFPIANAGGAFVANISSSVSAGYIYHITITNSDPTVAQTVYFYHKVNSQSTATLLWQVYLGTTSITNSKYEASFSDVSPLTFSKGLIVRKSAVGSDVRVNILAR